MSGRRERCAAVNQSLHLVVGPDVTAGRALRDVVLPAVAGGATVVQLRWKGGTTRDVVAAARALVMLLRPIGIPLVVNDRVDVALAAEADGVHVGREDMHPADVRRLVGPHMIVGVSVTSIADAGDADATLVDYAGVGPVFATTTKPDAAPPLGVDGLRDVVRLLRVPAVAIGGIDAHNAARVRAAGAAGLAVVSAVCGAADPRAAARALSAAVGPGSRPGGRRELSRRAP